MAKKNVATEGQIVLPDLLAADVIKSHQNDIRKSVLTIDRDVHANAVQCIMHAEKYGDTSLIQRLFMEIIDDKTGYRRQGLAVWLKTFTPARLTGKTVTLSGVDDSGARQAFQCQLANATPFTSMKSAAEKVTMVFRDGLTAKVAAAVREYRAAIGNTVITPNKPLRPKDASKPFYNGVHLDKMEAGFDAIEKALSSILSVGDETKAVYTAREALRAAELKAAEVAQ